MPRILLDTSVLVPAYGFGGRPRALLEAVIDGGVDLVTSPALLAELARTLKGVLCEHEGVQVVRVSEVAQGASDVCQRPALHCRGARLSQTRSISECGGLARISESVRHRPVGFCRRGVLCPPARPHPVCLCQSQDASCHLLGGCCVGGLNGDSHRSGHWHRLGRMGCSRSRGGAHRGARSTHLPES